jgi:hypothetical protein
MCIEVVRHRLVLRRSQTFSAAQCNLSDHSLQSEQGSYNTRAKL